MCAWIGCMQGGHDGFWRWLLEGLHTSMPSLFPAASTLPPSQDGFISAMSLVCHRLLSSPAQPFHRCCAQAVALAAVC